MYISVDAMVEHTIWRSTNLHVDNKHGRRLTYMYLSVEVSVDAMVEGKGRQTYM